MIISISGGSYFFIQSKHNGLVLEIEGGRRGGKVKTQRMNGNENQLWKWQDNSLISESGYSLHIEGGGRMVGTSVVAGKSYGHQLQKWEMRGDKIVSKLNNLVLDINGGSYSEGTDIIMWSSNPSTQLIGVGLISKPYNQSWILANVGKLFFRSIF